MNNVREMYHYLCRLGSKEQWTRYDDICAESGWLVDE
jgi:hypothetical protein